MTPSTSPTFTSSPSLRSMRLRTPGRRRPDLEIDLVGLELDERIARRHAIAFLAQPLGDPRIDDGFTDFRDDDVCGHMFWVFQLSSFQVPVASFQFCLVYWLLETG